VSGALRLVPREAGHAVLARDFNQMLNTGFFFRAPPSFDDIMTRLQSLERDINKAAA